MKMNYMRITGKYQNELACVVFTRKAERGPWDVMIELRGMRGHWHCSKDIRPCPTHATMLLDHLVKHKDLRGGHSIKPIGSKPQLAAV